MRTAYDTVARYFSAFNAGHTDAMLEELAEGIEHHVNEGNIRVGKEKFAQFCAHMSKCYKEELTDMQIFVNEDGTRAAAEFIVNGTYLSTDAGLPEARGQTYRLPAGSFMSLEAGKITRVTTYYNLSDWMKQVA